MVESTPTASLTRLYGRRDEIGVLDAHIRSLAFYRGGIVLIKGSSGSGKSSLLDVASVRARSGGIKFLHVAVGTGNRAAPLASLFDGSPDRRLSLEQDLEERLAKIASQGPLVIAVDDLDAADDATLVAIRSMAGRLAGRPILWLLTLAPGRADPTAQMLVVGGASVVSLGPLSRDAVGELARDILGGVPSDAVLDFVDDLAGRPAFIVELLQAFVAEELVEVTDGYARLTGLGLHRAMSELRRRTDRHAPGLEAALGLTRSELAVVELVAQGATNRQAAERLFLSPHTVSTHLRNTFEKLGICSRVELAVMFAQRQAGGEMVGSRSDAAGRGGLSPV